MLPSDERKNFLPTASWNNLQRRAELVQRVRRFFDERGFTEVETPLLSADSVVDQHLDPLSVTLFDDPQQPRKGRQLWLQTSPEFAMKRLLAAGAERIYQFSRAFRGGECGRLHNPEFTMLEWYRAGDDYAAGIDLLAELTAALLPTPPERVSYGDAFRRAVGCDPHLATPADFANVRCRLETPCPFDAADATADDWRHWLMLELVEPRLGDPNPTILFDYPESQAALATVREGTPPIAERFELYYRGIELANGYHELTDGEELRRRNRSANRLRVACGKYPLPEQSRLLNAMLAGDFPPCCGTALGFDRLVMLVLGAATIEEVIAFPISRA